MQECNGERRDSTGIGEGEQRQRWEEEEEEEEEEEKLSGDLDCPTGEKFPECQGLRIASIVYHLSVCLSLPR